MLFFRNSGLSCLAHDSRFTGAHRTDDGHERRSLADDLAADYAHRDLKMPSMSAIDRSASRRISRVRRYFA